MKKLDLTNFLISFKKLSKQSMNLSIYNGLFDCGCGMKHEMRGGNGLYIPLQGYYALLVRCPLDHSVYTHVKIKTFMLIQFKGFQSICYTKLEKTEMDSFDFFTKNYLNGNV